MAWLNLNMSNQTVKTDLKAKKMKLPQMLFFSRKTTNKIFMYLLVPFILQNFKKILRNNPELWRCAILGPKMVYLSWTKLFWYKLLLLLSSTYWPFSFKKLTADPELWGCAIFGPKMVHLPQTNFFFFLKIINIILIYLLAPLIVQNSKEIPPADPELWGFPKQ